MVSLSPHVWDIASDCLQILLSLVILIYFVRNRINQKRTLHKETIKHVGKSFKEHVLTQNLQQQIDQAFANIEESLTVEHENLRRVLEISHQTTEGERIPNVKSKTHSPKISDNRKSTTETAGDDRRNEKIHKYSARGLSIRKISDELRIPMSEVELILSLGEK